VRIEHWPEEGTGGESETYELVVCSNYEVEERPPYFGETRTWIGEPTWKPLDRATVESWWVGRYRADDTTGSGFIPPQLLLRAAETMGGASAR